MTLKEIISTAAEVWDVADDAVTGRDLRHAHKMPRVAAVAVAAETGFAHSTIARTFGRFHGSNFVRKAIAAAADFERSGPAFAHDIEELRSYVAIPEKEPVNPFAGPINAMQIGESVSRAFRVSPQTVFSKSRVKKAVVARSVVYRLLRDEGISTPRIARHFDRDHSTVLFALDKFDIYAKQFPQMLDVYKSHCAMRDNPEGEGK